MVCSRNLNALPQSWGPLRFFDVIHSSFCSQESYFILFVHLKVSTISLKLTWLWLILPTQLRQCKRILFWRGSFSFALIMVTPMLQLQQTIRAEDTTWDHAWNTHPGHGHQCQCWLHLLGIKEDLHASQEMWVSHLCSAKHWVAEEAEGLHFLGAAQESFAPQHPKPQATASAAWWEAAQRQLLSSLSILGLEYLAKLEFCFYKPWVYSFQAINLTVAGAIVFPL